MRYVAIVTQNETPLVAKVVRRRVFRNLAACRRWEAAFMRKRRHKVHHENVWPWGSSTFNELGEPVVSVTIVVEPLRMMRIMRRMKEQQVLCRRLSVTAEQAKDVVSNFTSMVPTLETLREGRAGSTL